MPKVYFDALSSSYVAGRAAGRIVDLLNFSFLNKMMQMIAWSSFLASRCQEQYINASSHRSQFEKGQKSSKSGQIFTYDSSHKQ